MSDIDTSVAVPKYPPNFLPGLKLKVVEEEITGSALSSLAPKSSDVLIFLKHFNPEFSLFPGQDPSLTVTYTGGIKDEPDQIEGDALAYYDGLASDEDVINLSGAPAPDDEQSYVNHLDIVNKGKE